MTGTWANWAGNQRASGMTVVHPRGPEEIARVVRRAAEEGRRVKVAGSGHSFTGIAVPVDVLVVLDRHAGVVALDRRTGLVTVEAGMTLGRLSAVLAEAGLSLTNLGDIDAQTVAGAMATGTHGTGERYGGLATQVRGLQMVLADGSVLDCEAEVLRAARVSLGALGVVSTVTLQAEPLFPMRAEEGPMGLSELLDRFDELAGSVDHFEAYWFPHTQRALVKRNTRLPPDAALDRLPRWREWVDDELLANTVFGWVQALGRRFPSTVRPLAQVSARGLAPRTFTDWSHRVFTSPRRVRFKEMEYALAREGFVPVLRELVEAIGRSDLRISFPVELRVAPADDIPLSTASGRDSAYVAVHVDHATPHRDYFDLVESVLAGAGGRPHWGKLHSLDAESLRPRYDGFDGFVALRDRLDPCGRFTNPYLDRVLGPPGSAA